jgi:hypothetical protein
VLAVAIAIPVLVYGTTFIVAFEQRHVQAVQVWKDSEPMQRTTQQNSQWETDQFYFDPDHVTTPLMNWMVKCARKHVLTECQTMAASPGFSPDVHPQ